MVTPAVVPTNIPFFQPKTITISMLKIFLIPNPKTVSSPKQLTAIAISKLVPITSSIEKALFSLKSCNTIKELTNIL